jgi:hypothetical protein
MLARLAGAAAMWARKRWRGRVALGVVFLARLVLVACQPVKPRPLRSEGNLGVRYGRPATGQTPPDSSDAPFTPLAARRWVTGAASF